MGNVEIMPRRETAVFSFRLKAVGRKAKFLEAMELLKSKYPMVPEANRVVLRRNVDDTYICIVLPKIVPGKKYISSTLYGVNRAKKYGDIIAICIADYTEIIQTEDGRFIQSEIAERVLGEEVEKISEDDVILHYGARDIVVINDLKTSVIRFVCLAALVLCVAVSTIIVAGRQIKKRQGEAIVQKEIEEINKEKISARLEAEKQLAALQEEYKGIEQTRLQNMYSLLNILYRCVGRNSVIENLTIEKDNFSMDVTVKDSVLVLSTFEKCNEIRDVKMNRTTIQNGVERVNFTGHFFHKVKEDSSETNIDRQIEFYRESLESERKRLGRMGERKLSEYAGSVRKYLHKNGCEEQYLQYRINSGIAVLECFLESDSRKILSFISEVQNDSFMDEEMADILGLHIKNKGNSSVQATIRFWTGIQADAIEIAKANAYTNMESEKDDGTPDDLSHLFKSESRSVKPVQATASVSQPKTRQLLSTVPEIKPAERKKDVSVVRNESQEVMPIVELKKNLVYIGNAKLGDDASIIFKDLEMDVIYTLPLLESEPNRKMDFCLMSGDSMYSVYIGGICYRVRRVRE